jgi:tRNA threonylcarbamoyladenosine biosynthesis protein TsaB
MRILGIDTSTRSGAVGLIENDVVLAETLQSIALTHSETLLSAIQHVLHEGGCDVGSIDGWAISLGPGSFTGLRIGVSTVKGLAFATGKPIAGVPTLDALAAQISPTPYLICPVLDARKGELYTASYRYHASGVLTRVSEYRAVEPEILIAEAIETTLFVGSGIATYGQKLRAALPSLALFAPLPLHLLRGATVAHLGMERLLKKDTLDASTFTPIYVRASEAEVKWREKVGH